MRNALVFEKHPRVCARLGARSFIKRSISLLSLVDVFVCVSLLVKLSPRFYSMSCLHLELSFDVLNYNIQL